MGTYLSKSKYLAGLQCSKLLWFYYNSKESIPEIDESQQAIFDQGQEVGNWAQKKYPEGVEITMGSYDETSYKTKEFLKKKQPLFEASFIHGQAYSRTDILVPVGKDKWDIIEVKSSTEVKDINIEDVAFQLYCAKGSGLKVNKCFLMFINNEYTKEGNIDVNELFKIEDITALVKKKQASVKKNITKMLKIIEAKKYLEIKIGAQCNDPYPCPLEDVCWKFLPENNVTELYYMGKKAFELTNKGIYDITKIPQRITLSDKQQLQKKAVIENTIHVDKEKIAEFIAKFKYPIYFLDFETFNTAIPIFDGSKPYQQIPFQFSLHVLDKPNGKLKHFEFLADSNEDPRSELLLSLKAIKDKGTILAYNMSFEKRVLKDLAEKFPREAEWINEIIIRIDDLIIPFKNFWYYHPKQHGSCSIKYVLPALTNITYSNLEIKKGDQASREYYRINFKECSKEEKEKTRKALLIYCGQDTQAMVDIFNILSIVSEVKAK
jgi:hypothetical protein